MASPPNADGASRKKKLVAGGLSTLLLLAVVGTIAAFAVRSNSNDAGNNPQSSDKSIKSICEPTDYPKQCEESLTAVAGNSTDVKDLVRAAFKATVDHIRYAFNHSQTLQAAAADPRTSGALTDCRELFNYAIDDLQNSVGRFGGDVDMSKLDDIVDDIKVWLSAVVTYQETCLDGFENATGDAAESMRKALTASMEMASNALAIVDDVAAVVDEVGAKVTSRRLLSAEDGGSPSWARRRMIDVMAGMKPNMVVAKDGSGGYKTITSALAHVPENLAQVFVIYVKAGVYAEQVTVGKTQTNVMMYGDGPTKTRITGRLNFVDGVNTFKTASFIAIGDGFIAKDMGFENSAGAAKHQAVALRVQSDRSVFYNCHVDGYQDTLYTHTHRQFYRDCTITGTIDFIFGDAAAFLQNCNLVVRRPLDNQQTIVTAQGRKDRREATGIVIHNCTISPDPAYAPVAATLKAYLGRPWKAYSRTLIMQTQIEQFIQPEGWLPWQGDFGLTTCVYGEFDNRGPGSNMAGRVTWKGVKKIDYNQAGTYAAESFIQGNVWLPGLGVPYVAGLLPMTQQGRMH